MTRDEAIQILLFYGFTKDIRYSYIYDYPHNSNTFLNITERVMHLHNHPTRGSITIHFEPLTPREFSHRIERLL